MVTKSNDLKSVMRTDSLPLHARYYIHLYFTKTVA